MNRKVSIILYISLAILLFFVWIAAIIYAGNKTVDELTPQEQIIQELEKDTELGDTEFLYKIDVVYSNKETKCIYYRIIVYTEDDVEIVYYARFVDNKLEYIE